MEVGAEVEAEEGEAVPTVEAGGGSGGEESLSVSPHPALCLSVLTLFVVLNVRMKLFCMKCFILI